MLEHTFNRQSQFEPFSFADLAQPLFELFVFPFACELGAALLRLSVISKLVQLSSLAGALLSIL